MVKMFSVDWMAQSHVSNNNTPKEEEPLAGVVDNIQPRSSSSRPHVPCMVQPRQPSSYEKGYLQLKPKTPSTTYRGHYSRQSSVMSSPSSASEHSSNSCGYSSGYESEAAASECPSVDTEEGQSSSAESELLDREEEEEDAARDHQRRVRTKFSTEQINRLERIFNKHKYLDAGERVKTAEKLKLSETQVRTWFQNRRMKLKREVQDLRADFHLHAPSAAMFQGFHQHHHKGSVAVPQIQYAASQGSVPVYPAGLAGQRLQYQAFYPAVVPQFPMHQQQHMVSHHHLPMVHGSPLFY